MSGWQSWTKRPRELGEAEKSDAHCPQAPCFPPAGMGAAWARRPALGEKLCFPNTLQWARTPPRAPAEPHGQLRRFQGTPGPAVPRPHGRQCHSCLHPGALLCHRLGGAEGEVKGAASQDPVC